MDKSNLRPVQYTVGNGVRRGYFLTFEQIMCRNREQGGIEDMEAYIQGVVETVDGNITKVQLEDMKFLDR